MRSMRVYQDPDAVLDYQWDWSDWLEPGETIASYTLESSDPALVLTNVSASTTAVTAYVSGGTAGRTYDVTNHIVSSLGREDDGIITFVITNQVSSVPSVCEWPVSYAGCDDTTDTLMSLPVSGREAFEDMAIEYLWRWTKKRFGVCMTTIRPCRQQCWDGISTYGRSPTAPQGPWTPALLNGAWYNLGCGSGTCGAVCGCTEGSTLHFEKPIVDVVDVTLDGVTLSPSAYRVDSGTMLVRQDGGRWPYCQDMSVPLGGKGTWSVTVRTGTVVPGGGQIAAGKLARELAKASCGSSKCELPQRWQTITRQGVTISAAIDLFQGLDEGKTGIWLIDAWVASVNKPDIGVSIAVPGYRRTGRTTTYGG